MHEQNQNTFKLSSQQRGAMLKNIIYKLIFQFEMKVRLLLSATVMFNLLYTVYLNNRHSLQQVDILLLLQL